MHGVHIYNQAHIAQQYAHQYAHHRLIVQATLSAPSFDSETGVDWNDLQ